MVTLLHPIFSLYDIHGFRLFLFDTFYMVAQLVLIYPHVLLTFTNFVILSVLVDDPPP